jgi:AcrR family transcriptional regulator
VASVVSPVDAGERAKQERRRQILSAAKQVFADAGYHGASIHAIIERAQIARGTFYLYFESKAAVFAGRATAAGPAPRAGRGHARVHRR